MERWQEIARELGSYDMEGGGPTGASMRRAKPDNPLGDWVEAEAACKRIAELEELACEAGRSGVELSDERMRYVVVQIGRETWEKLRALVG